MVGLWSPDPPPEPESLEENNPGYLIVLSASDDEHSNEGYEGYEPLSDADVSDMESDDYENEVDPPFANAANVAAATTASIVPATTSLSTSAAAAADDDDDCDIQDIVRTTDLPKCSGCREFSNTIPRISDGNEAECSLGSTERCNSQVNQAGAQTGPSLSRLEMGEQQVADVMAAMANITLPPSAVPQWATVVPEDQWIQHILARVKNLQNNRDDNK